MDETTIKHVTEIVRAKVGVGWWHGCEPRLKPITCERFEGARSVSQGKKYARKQTRVASRRVVTSTNLISKCTACRVRRACVT